MALATVGLKGLNVRSSAFADRAKRYGKQPLNKYMNTHVTLNAIAIINGTGCASRKFWS